MTSNSKAKREGTDDNWLLEGKQLREVSMYTIIVFLPCMLGRRKSVKLERLNQEFGKHFISNDKKEQETRKNNSTTGYKQLHQKLQLLIFCYMQAIKIYLNKNVQWA